MIEFNIALLIALFGFLLLNIVISECGNGGMIYHIRWDTAMKFIYRGNKIIFGFGDLKTLSKC